MEDTLRYFFSAMFQGFAALIALGAMFYLYYKEINYNKLNRLEEKIKYLLNPNNSSEVDAEIVTVGFAQYTDNFLNNHPNWNRYTSTKNLFDTFNSLKKKIDEIESKLPTILKFTITILIASITLLFLVDLNNTVDIIILILGVVLTIFSIVTLIKIMNFIILIIKD